MFSVWLAAYIPRFNENINHAKKRDIIVTPRVWPAWIYMHSMLTYLGADVCVLSHVSFHRVICFVLLFFSVCLLLYLFSLLFWSFPSHIRARVCDNDVVALLSAIFAQWIQETIANDSILSVYEFSSHYFTILSVNALVFPQTTRIRISKKNVNICFSFFRLLSEQWQRFMRQNII